MEIKVGFGGRIVSRRNNTLNQCKCSFADMKCLYLSIPGEKVMAKAIVHILASDFVTVSQCDSLFLYYISGLKRNLAWSRFSHFGFGFKCRIICFVGCRKD